MKTIILATIVSLAFAPGAKAENCKKGAVYQSLQSGSKIVVKRIGSGKSDFTGIGRKQAAMALDFFTDDGQRGAIYGPMRSIMFPADVKELTKDGFRWRPASADPNGFFRVMTDDGQNEIFTLTYVGCAR
ncbi:hypothetical protein [Shinella zoogloeoides]